MDLQKEWVFAAIFFIFTIYNILRLWLHLKAKRKPMAAVSAGLVIFSICVFGYALFYAIKFSMAG